MTGPLVIYDELDVPSSPVGNMDRIGSLGRHELAKQKSVFNRRPNQFIALDYEDLVAFMYRHLVCKQPAPWKHDWRRLFFRQMPLYTTVRWSLPSTFIQHP